MRCPKRILNGILKSYNSLTKIPSFFIWNADEAGVGKPKKQDAFDGIV
jgi:hypothetical protein